MKFFRIKFLAKIFVVLLLVGFAYYYRDNIGRILRNILNKVEPCQRPITYSIASIDPKFGITKTALLNNIKKAETIWELPINKQLFEYSPTGDLKINFIYDYRQKATDALQKLGIVINDDRATYDALKAKYDSLTAFYNQEKTNITALVAKYDTDKSAYENDVKYWNSRGGAPKTEYNALEQRRIDLNNQIAIINQAQDSLNILAETINSTATLLNKLIAELNLQVTNYNTIGASTGKEFNEGEYVSNASGQTINIFQFNNSTQLLRVLAHEFGHALGIDHLSNPKAIMYYLNEGMNEKLTADDLTALKKVCGIK